MLNRWNEIFHFQRKGWRYEDAGWIVEVWFVLNSLIAGGRGYSVIEVAICEIVGQDCGNGSKALDSTEKRLLKEKKTIDFYKRSPMLSIHFPHFPADSYYTKGFGMLCSKKSGVA
ncbi:hypothetical protein AVEN_20065-1 [Araneus ventricosus]|uniref:Uncharacterized protein n=1 Tax=Araneus ventricosus TaxID=182803 RepID=A0A4Y2JXV2_ARAVE|nr:hypothetical protein AVEN_20065-1 [Araneus ventricosus]